MPFKLVTVRKLTKEQVADVKKFNEQFGLTEENQEKFSLWVVNRLEALKAPKPETAPDEEIPQGRYLVFIEDDLAFGHDDLQGAIREAYGTTETGQRISILDTNTNEPVAYYIRLEDKLRQVPDHLSGKVHALSPDSAKRVAGAKPAFPVWLPLVAIGAKLIL